MDAHYQEVATDWELCAGTVINQLSQFLFVRDNTERLHAWSKFQIERFRVIFQLKVLYA